MTNTFTTRESIYAEPNQTIRSPKLFDTSDDVTTTAMRFGFQLDGRGWRRVMARLCVRLEPLAQDGFRILAVKSKYATLRVICRGGSEATDAVIADAQAVAAETCQICGASGGRPPRGGCRSGARPAQALLLLHAMVEQEICLPRAGLCCCFVFAVVFVFDVVLAVKSDSDQNRDSGWTSTASTLLVNLKFLVVHGSSVPQPAGMHLSISDIECRVLGTCIPNQ